MDLRDAEIKKLENNDMWTLGDVTTINLTQVRGGVQSNVVPPMVIVGFDIRLAIDVDHVEFENQVRRRFLLRLF